MAILTIFYRFGHFEPFEAIFWLFFRYLNSPRSQLSLNVLVGSFYSCPNMTILLKIGVSCAVPSLNPEPLKNVFTQNFPKNLKKLGSFEVTRRFAVKEDDEEVENGSLLKKRRRPIKCLGVDDPWVGPPSSPKYPILTRKWPVCHFGRF